MKTLLKWLGIGLTVLVSAAMLGAAIVYAVSNKQIRRRYNVPAAWIAAHTDSITVARGRHVYRAIGKCIDCHGENGGGTMFINSPAFGRIPASNLTSGLGGRGATYTDQDFARAIQHGVKRNGRGAVIMPAEAYRFMSNADLVAVISYLRTMPPVDSSWPAPTFGPIARVLMALGKLPAFAASYIDHEGRDVLPPATPDTTAEYGHYLVNVGGCSSCHNASLSGGSTGQPGAPLAANLTPTGIGDWTEADLVRVLRQGKGPGGVDINNEFMPWKSSGALTDAEIHALWQYLRSLPAKEFGQL